MRYFESECALTVREGSAPPTDWRRDLGLPADGTASDSDYSRTPRTSNAPDELMHALANAIADAILPRLRKRRPRQKIRR